jgi:sigma-B regulation protein RsbU (phosphoserine phosphatase)
LRGGEAGSDEVEVLPLGRTGMAMGVVEDTTWERRDLFLEAGDVLVLYSDGITEAHNTRNELFGEQGLLQAIEAQRGAAAQDTHDRILGRARGFVGAAPQSDDLLLLVVKRDA